MDAPLVQLDASALRALAEVLRIHPDADVLDQAVVALLDCARQADAVLDDGTLAAADAAYWHAAERGLPHTAALYAALRKTWPVLSPVDPSRNAARLGAGALPGEPRHFAGPLRGSPMKSSFTIIGAITGLLANGTRGSRSFAENVDPNGHVADALTAIRDAAKEFQHSTVAFLPSTRVVRTDVEFEHRGSTTVRSTIERSTRIADLPELARFVFGDSKAKAC